MWDLPHSFACAGFRVVGTSYMAMRFQLLFFVFRIGSNRPCAIMPMAFGIVGLKTSSNSKQNLDSREKSLEINLGKKYKIILKLKRPFFWG